LHVNNDFWSDDGFNIDTKMPILGFHKNIDKRAILVVISRLGKMKLYNCDNRDFDDYNNINNINISQDLTTLENLIINSVIYQIYGS